VSAFCAASRLFLECSITARRRLAYAKSYARNWIDALSMDLELKPCPYCGGEAVLEEVRRDIAPYNVTRWSVGCKADEGETDGHPCIGYMSVITYPRRTDAANAWNKRAVSAGEKP
jgi:hypothetical protein